MIFLIKVTDVMTQKRALKVTDVLTHPGNRCPDICQSFFNLNRSNRALAVKTILADVRYE